MRVKRECFVSSIHDFGKIENIKYSIKDFRVLSKNIDIIDETPKEGLFNYFVIFFRCFPV